MSIRAGFIANSLRFSIAVMKIPTGPGLREDLNSGFC